MVFFLTEAMPEKIKNNFIYSELWKNINERDKNATLIFTGDVGTGKSCGALKFGEDLDETFNIDRVCFSVEEFLNKAKDLKPGQVLVFDESTGSEEGLDSRNSLTELNKLMSFFSTISRAKRLILIYCTPLLSSLDKRIKMIGVSCLLDFKGVDFENKKSRAVFYWSYASSKGDKTLTPKPRLKDKESGEITEVPFIRIALPKPELVEAYQAKKNEFIERKINEWAFKLRQKKHQRPERLELRKYYRRAKKILPELRSKQGRISVALIQFKLNLSESMAKKLKVILDSEKSSEPLGKL